MWPQQHVEVLWAGLVGVIGYVEGLPGCAATARGLVLALCGQAVCLEETERNMETTVKKRF